MKNNLSVNNFEEAKKFIPGGVNSPVRAFKSVGGTPILLKRLKISICLMLTVIDI